MSTQKAPAKEKQGIPTMYWMFAGLIVVLLIGVMLRVLNSTLMLITFVLGVMSILFIEEARKKVPNALIWRHPDNGGGADFTIREPLKEQRRHPMPFAWWGLKKVPIYFWYENKVETEQTKEDVRPLSTEVVPNTCLCGYHAEGKMADRLFSAHVLWNPKKTSTSEDDFNRQHHQVTAADIKGAAVAVATAVQDKPVVKTEYRIEPYEPVPKLFNKITLQLSNGQTQELTASLSPNALFEQIDWSAAMRFRTVKNKLIEKVKLGMGLLMVGIICVALFLIVGAMKQPASAPPSEPPTTQQQGN